MALAAPAWVSARRDAVTFDETAHLAAGLGALERGDFRLNPEHPPLAKLWAALPLALSGTGGLDYASPAWRRGDEWVAGFELLNGPLSEAERRDPLDRLGPARAAMIVLGLIHGLAVYAWAREIRGPTAGLVALSLFAFEPTVLAHSRLVTTDLPASLGFTLTLWCFWRFHRRPSWPRAAATGAVLGIALLMKHSTLLLLPGLAFLAVLLSVLSSGPERARRLALHAAALAGATLLALGVLWAGYAFRFSAAPAGPTREDRWDWDRVRPRNVHAASALDSARAARIAPEAYIYGLSYVLRHDRRLAFLNGRMYLGSDWAYFPEAFLLKSTVPWLFLLGWTVVWAAGDSKSRSADLLVPGLGAVAYCAAAMAGSLNIGHRHLVPVYPLLFVVAGVTLPAAAATRGGRILAGGLLAAHAATSLASFPRYLSYFNHLAGGPREAWRYLVDSNLDWGQDLPRLKAWMDEHEVERVWLAYWGTADPRAYDIAYDKVYQYRDFRPGEPRGLPAPGEYLAVSATLLQGVGVDPPELRRFFRDVRRTLAAVGYAGDSILIYRLPPVGSGTGVAREEPRNATGVERLYPPGWNAASGARRSGPRLP